MTKWFVRRPLKVAVHRMMEGENITIGDTTIVGREGKYLVKAKIPYIISEKEFKRGFDPHISKLRRKGKVGRIVGVTPVECYVCMKIYRLKAPNGKYCTKKCSVKGRKATAKAWLDRNRERMIPIHRAWYAKNRDRILAQASKERRMAKRVLRKEKLQVERIRV